MKIVGTIVNKDMLLQGLLLKGRPSEFGNSIGKEYMMAPFKLSEVKSLIKEGKIKDYKINEKGNIEGIGKKLSNLPMYDSKGNFLDKRMEIRSAIEDSGNLVGAVVYFPLMGKEKKLKVDNLSLLYEYFEATNFGLRERDNKYYITGKGETKKEDIPVIDKSSANKSLNNGFVSFEVIKENRHMVGFKGIENEKLVIPQRFNYKNISYEVVSIGDNAFDNFNDNCKNLISVVIPNGVKSIGKYSFSCCENLVDVQIPNTVKKIDDGAFSDCCGLYSIVLPNSLTSLGFDVFSDCEKLEKIYYKGSKSKWEKIKKPRDWANGLPKNCKIIYNNSEEDFVWDISESVLTPFEIVKENRYMIGFKGVEDEKLVIPERFEKNGSGYKVVSIGDYAFMGCTNLVDIIIPNTVISIRDCAFADCSKLTSIEIPNSVIALHDEVFGGCSNLTSIILPNSVSSFGRYVFDDCSRLETIYYRGSESDWNAIKKAKGWADSLPKNCKVIYNYKD